MNSGIKYVPMDVKWCVGVPSLLHLPVFTVLLQSTHRSNRERCDTWGVGKGGVHSHRRGMHRALDLLRASSMLVFTVYY